jgi:hypothetical protein
MKVDVSGLVDLDGNPEQIPAVGMSGRERQLANRRIPRCRPAVKAPRSWAMATALAEGWV